MLELDSGNVSGNSSGNLPLPFPMDDLKTAPHSASPDSTNGQSPSDETIPVSPARKLFLDSQGLRPGWGLALYVVMFVVVLGIGNWLAESLELGKLWSQILEEALLLAAAMVPALAMARIEKRPFGAYGLPLIRGVWKLLWTGTAWGFLGITVLLGILHGLHAFDFGHILLHGTRLIRFAVFWGVLFVMVGFFEEFLMRGYMQFTLARQVGFWRAAVLLSAVFGAVHLANKGEAWTGALGAGFIGLFLCLTLRRTGSLWFAVGFHAAWDWGESFFYSVPDSGQVSPGHLLSSSFHGPRWITGGTVGPEGSVVCFVVVAVIWVVFERLHPQATSIPAQK
jgi:uncharacterized protein